jgi:hypothetical protein
VDLATVVPVVLTLVFVIIPLLFLGLILAGVLGAAGSWADRLREHRLEED